MCEKGLIASTTHLITNAFVDTQRPVMSSEYKISAIVSFSDMKPRDGGDWTFRRVVDFLNTIARCEVPNVNKIAVICNGS